VRAHVAAQDTHRFARGQSVKVLSKSFPVPLINARLCNSRLFTTSLRRDDGMFLSKHSDAISVHGMTAKTFKDVSRKR
jgi:hypothetical protein